MAAPTGVFHRLHCCLRASNHAPCPLHFWLMICAPPPLFPIPSFTCSGNAVAYAVSAAGVHLWRRADVGGWAELRGSAGCRLGEPLTGALTLLHPLPPYFCVSVLQEGPPEEGCAAGKRISCSLLMDIVTRSRT